MPPLYEAVIGLEIHAQLRTTTKLFCGCSAKYGAEPNTNVCPVCLGHPGTLPVLNKRAVEFASLMGLACNSVILDNSSFARKNYFYPDLPKGYQISQLDRPICLGGSVHFTNKDGLKKEILLNRIHLEEDAGKSIHLQDGTTAIDFNRSGVPLIEIVTEPVITSAADAFLFLSSLRQIVRYLGICDGNMEEGSLRCDANVSVRPAGSTELGVKTEIKNMNSLKNVEKAINFELSRQIDLLEDGGTVLQETLLWDADLETSLPMRSKEDANDYRYFPDPDLVPFSVSPEWLAEIKKSLPEMPGKRLERFLSQYGLPYYDSEILTSSRELADFYENITACTSDYKSASNWVMSDVMKILNERKLLPADFPVPPSEIANLINLVNDQVVSIKIAKAVFEEMIESGKSAENIISSKGLEQISDSTKLSEIIDDILMRFPGQVQEYRNGKEKVFGFFVGQVMKETKGKANPNLVNNILSGKLIKPAVGK
ncbi:MAG: Asp-tRNA(Asn)/Glu-tRNA(Gln) amidotransferase subunit GatB [Ignavibacteriaceae bacterium]